MFKNLDFATLGSTLTHPRRLQRHLSNLAYTTITATLEPFGKNATYPLMPGTEEKGLASRIYNGITSKINDALPFDK